MAGFILVLEKYLPVKYSKILLYTGKVIQIYTVVSYVEQFVAT